MIPHRIGTLGSSPLPMEPLPPAESLAPPAAADFSVEAAPGVDLSAPASAEQRFVLQPVQPGKPTPVQLDQMPIAGAPGSAPGGRFQANDILAQLQQLRTVTPAMKFGQAMVAFLTKRELAVAVEGYVVITGKGLTYLADFGLL